MRSIRSALKGIFLLTFFILTINAMSFNIPGLTSDVYAGTPKVSNESVDVLTKIGQAMAEVADAVKPAIVNISTTKTEKVSENPNSQFFDDPFFKKYFGDKFKHPETPKERKSVSLGSGVIVSSDGHILTNNHVVKDADDIKVLLPDKREFHGKIIGSDLKTDLSIIKIEAKDLPTVTIGDSDRLRVGEVVLTIGSPYGLNQTITMGIVSAVGRANVGIADYEDFIQTDAAINPGNSGGALVNTRGELVGINTAIFSTTGGYQGIGFAIPSNMAKLVMDSLIKSGKVTRGWLGVSIQPLTQELARQFNLKEDAGALVGDVIEGSPAEKAGIMRGDVIIKFNGKKVDEPYNLRNTVANTKPGEEAEIVLIRNGKTETIKVTISELPAESQAAAPALEYNNVLKGVNVQGLTPELIRQMNMPEKIKGVVVTEIVPESPAEGKLMQGDIIQEINRKAVSNLQAYQEAVSALNPDEGVLLLVFRRGTSVFITISP
ncbi:MAG: DegQ family serine endoprotease [Nitrospirae bacterium]|nr:DegQ family serine endoprotease [Nitrospirota bacterium]